LGYASAKRQVDFQGVKPSTAVVRVKTFSLKFQSNASAPAERPLTVGGVGLVGNLGVFRPSGQEEIWSRAEALQQLLNLCKVQTHEMLWPGGFTVRMYSFLSAIRINSISDGFHLPAK